MRTETYIRRGHTILFGLLILLSIIAGAISSWLTARYNGIPSRASNAVRERTYFLLFVSWWTVIGATIYMVLFLHSASNGSLMTSVASHLIFMFLTWIFWTAGAIAITVALGGGNNCSRIAFPLTYCNQLNALEGFAWACWIITTIILFFVILQGISSLRRGDGAGGQLVTD